MSAVNALLIDIGNSRVKWAECRDGVLGPAHASSREAETAKGFCSLLDSLSVDVTQAYGVNVAGPACAAAVEAALDGEVALQVEWLSAAQQFGVLRNGYKNPEHLGADRWAALIATQNVYQGPALIVDVGTACTIDALDPRGQHLGGLILPGLHLMGMALSAETSDIAGRAGTMTAPREATELFCTSTGEAVSQGCLTALVGAVERAYSALLQMHPECQLVVTGGDAPTLTGRVGLNVEHRPNLVLEGLAVVAAAEDSR